MEQTIHIGTDKELASWGKRLCQEAKPTLKNQVGWIMISLDHKAWFETMRTPPKTNVLMATLYSDGEFRGTIAVSPELTQENWEAATKAVWNSQ